MVAQRKIAVRVDASIAVGTGHFMRCLTLTKNLKRQGAQIRFVCRELPFHLQTMLLENGIEYKPLCGGEEVVTGDLAHSHWLPVGQEADMRSTIDALADHCWDWLIVDHYALDLRWESAMRLIAKRIMVIDDIADRQHDCDLLLDQNYYADMQLRYESKTSDHCRLLLGPRYALLREEFRELRKRVLPRTGHVKRILVFFGGVDADNYTGLAVHALSELGVCGIQVDVVIGEQHPFREIIEASCAAEGYLCHVQTNRMAELMAAADIAIGAAGSASWERCCLGVPALLIALADNQVEIAKELDSVGGCIYLGSKEVATILITQRIIANLFNMHEQLERVSKCAFSMVDGLGVDRVCQELEY